MAQLNGQPAQQSQSVLGVRSPVSGRRASELAAVEPVDFGARLRAARERAGLTQEQVGLRIDCSRHAIGRLEESVDPRLSLRQLLRICDVLGTSVSALLGDPMDGDTPVNRRQLLQAAATGAVISTAAPEAGVVGASDVEELSQAISSLRLLDQRTGGDRLTWFAERLVVDAERLLTGRLTARIANRLQTEHGRAAVLAGWLSQDSGRYQQAAGWYSRAMTSAQLANDPLLTAEACAHAAFLATKIEQPTRVVQYAQAGQRAALAGQAGPRTRALLAAREATGHAQLGDTRHLDEVAARIWKTWDSTHGSDTAWSEFVSAEELSGIIGKAYSLAGQHSRGLGPLQDASRMSVTNRPRNTASWQVHLAIAHAGAGDPAQAARVATDALPSVRGMSSWRLRNDIQQLALQLRPHAQIAEVRDFRQLVTEANLV